MGWLPFPYKTRGFVVMFSLLRSSFLNAGAELLNASWCPVLVGGWSRIFQQPSHVDGIGASVDFCIVLQFFKRRKKDFLES